MHATWFERGDAYLATVRAYTPASGDLSEQFDQRSGAQTSAKQLGLELRRVHFVRLRRAASRPQLPGAAAAMSASSQNRAEPAVKTGVVRQVRELLGALRVSAVGKTLAVLVGGIVVVVALTAYGQMS